MAGSSGPATFLHSSIFQLWPTFCIDAPLFLRLSALGGLFLSLSTNSGLATAPGIFFSKICFSRLTCGNGFATVYLRAGGMAAEHSSTERSRQKAAPHERRKKGLFWLLLQTVRGHGGDSRAMKMDRTCVNKNRCGDTPDAHRPAQKITERRWSAGGKGSHQVNPNPYSRPCGDTAVLGGR